MDRSSSKPLMLGVSSPFAENPSTMTLEAYQDTCIPVHMEIKKSKMHWIIAAIFIVADMVGGGVVAMPVAFKQSGLYVGVVFMLVICAIFEYTGYQLGRVWVVMQRRWPVYKQHCRKPFPEMAYRSMGRTAQRLTSCAIQVTLFGISVVYLLLSANIIHYFIGEMLQINMCGTIILLALIIAPFTYLKSPGDFWIVVVFAMVTTILSVAMIIFGVFLDHDTCIQHVRYGPVTPGNVILSMGTFLFAFSGHYVFPTIVNDMRRPVKFKKSIWLGFGVVVLLYMPLSVYSYIVYGDSMDKSVIYSVQTQWLQQGANCMIAAHCVLTLVIVINPVNQEIEEYFKVPHHFGIGRFTVRSIMLVLVVFVGLTMPEFGPVMNLVGSSTIPLGCVIMPSLFYLWINAASEEQWLKGEIPSIKEFTMAKFFRVYDRSKKPEFWFNIFIMIVALCGMAIGTYKGVQAVAEAEFSTPCYLRYFEEAKPTNHNTFLIKQHCCGWARNVSVFGNGNMCGGL